MRSSHRPSHLRKGCWFNTGPLYENICSALGFSIGLPAVAGPRSLAEHTMDHFTDVSLTTRLAGFFRPVIYFIKSSCVCRHFDEPEPEPVFLVNKDLKVILFGLSWQPVRTVPQEHLGSHFWDQMLKVCPFVVAMISRLSLPWQKLCLTIHNFYWTLTVCLGFHTETDLWSWKALFLHLATDSSWFLRKGTSAFIHSFLDLRLNYGWTIKQKPTN